MPLHNGPRMQTKYLLGSATLALALAAGATARGQTATLASTDFTFTLWRVNTDGTDTALNTDTLATYFTAARCACPGSMLASLTLSSAGVTKLGTSTLDAQLMLGSDCDNVDTATACTSLGSTLTLSSSKSTTQLSLSSADLFSGSCTGDAASTRLWAIVRVDGTRLGSQPSLPLTLRSAGPVTPTAVTAKTADSGLLVSWSTAGDATTLQGHQLFCSPAPATASTAAFETCAALPAAAGDNPFASYDPTFICSDLIAVGTNSARVKGLQNGTLYQVAVAAVGVDGTPSAPSAVVTATPGPTNGFDDLYFDSGGTAATGCAVAATPPASGGRVLATAILVLCLTTRRRRLTRAMRRRALPTLGLGLCLAALAAPNARAQSGSDGATAGFLLNSSEPSVASGPSPRHWNLELRFGPYRPDVDSEFAERGSAARPYAQVFSSARHLLFQVEVDRHVSHRYGTWAIGANAGYMHASAAALAADLTTRTGDETALTLLPLSLSLVYRADFLRELEGVGLIPYAKGGLDCTFWRISDTARSATTEGKTLGWHGALGVSLDLASFDPDAARGMDRESGVNQTAIFFEVARYALDGFGSDAVLHLGDTTWLGGLMFEM